MCRITMGHLRVTVGLVRVAVGHPKVTTGHLWVTMGYFKATVVHIRVTKSPYMKNFAKFLAILHHNVLFFNNCFIIK